MNTLVAVLKKACFHRLLVWYLSQLDTARLRIGQPFWVKPDTFPRTNIGWLWYDLTFGLWSHIPLCCVINYVWENLFPGRYWIIVEDHVTQRVEERFIKGLQWYPCRMHYRLAAWLAARAIQDDHYARTFADTGL